MEKVCGRLSRTNAATLSEAIDPAVFRANQAVIEYATKLQHSTIAALLPATEQEMVGANVIERLRGPGDVVLIGRSGLGKSFHLEHYRRLCFAFGEVPFLVHAGITSGICNGRYSRVLRPIHF